MPDLVPVSIVIIVSVTSEWSGLSPLYNVSTLSHHCSQNMGLRKYLLPSTSTQLFLCKVWISILRQIFDQTPWNPWQQQISPTWQSESGGQSRSWTKFRVSLRFCKEGDKRRTSDTCAGSSARSVILKFMKDVSCECREGGKKWLVSNTWATCASPFIPTPAPGPWFTLLGQFGI